MSWWLQILLPLAVVLGPLIGQLVKKLNEHAELKRIELERERLRDELLRTGRTPEGVAQVSAQARPEAPRPVAQGGAAARTNLEEIARRRQAQLEELRRRQQAARAQPAARPTPRAPAPSAPPTHRTGKAVPAPRPPAQAQASAKARAQTKRPARVVKPSPSGRVSKEPVAAGKRGARQPSPGLEVQTSEPRTEVTRHPAVLRLPRTSSEWRRAIVIAEILDPPVSLREDGF